MAKVLAKVIHLMDLSKITTSTLEALVKLTKKRDMHSGRAQENLKLQSLAPIPAESPNLLVRRKKGKGRRRSARRGCQPRPRSFPKLRPVVDAVRLKARILAALRTAGDKGVAVKELSAKLGVKNQNVHVWFSSTGKKLGTIQRVGAGRYRLKPGA